MQNIFRVSIFILCISNILLASKIDNYFHSDVSKTAFSHPVSGMTDVEEDQFMLGKSFFTIPWVVSPASTTARDGLGPFFSANTCMHCHPRNGAGLTVDKKGEMHRSYLLRVSHQSTTNKNFLDSMGFEPDSMYGAQISRHANRLVVPEAKVTLSYEHIKGFYPDGSVYVLRKPQYKISEKGYGDFDKETILAGRIASALLGLGLLEAIPEEDILKYQDINDTNHDGISGKANYAYNPESKKKELGRFTWKASATTVKHQSAAAAHYDMGLSNPLFPSHNCTVKQKECRKNMRQFIQLDLPEQRLNAISFYVSHLALPLRRFPQKYKEGETLFRNLNCIACHTPMHKTKEGIPVPAYSDLLLHDMGEGLSDGRSEFLAKGNEWRTAPLWGIGLYKKVSTEAYYLHDGRARSIEEAILWHGGEGEKSKKDFMALPRQAREKVLDFLHSI